MLMRAPVHVRVHALRAAATSEGMAGEGIQAVQALFDASLELWTGRVAMVGVAGLIAAEVVKGDSFF